MEPLCQGRQIFCPARMTPLLAHISVFESSALERNGAFLVNQRRFLAVSIEIE